jgi:drug/metabolite transporter (DMT)-like permease
VTWIGCFAATVACLPFVPELVGGAAKVDGSAIGWMIYLGVGPTAIGFATWAIALRRTSAGRMASIAYLIPVVAIGLGWLILGEVPPLLAIGGGILCLAGVLVARRRRRDSKTIPAERETAKLTEPGTT